MSSWKKIENENGFPYYINQELNIKQWDHPKFCDIKQAIDDCNYVTFATYRLAMKIRILQQYLYLEDTSLDIVISIFEKHRLTNCENSLILEPYDLEAILLDIFSLANKINHTNIDVDFAMEIVMNLFYNIFDKFREGKIQVICMKILLVLLCNWSLTDFQKYLFSIYADHNNCITRLKLTGMLKKIELVITYLHEDSFFNNSLLQCSVDKCFQESPGFIGITETNFINWCNSDIRYFSFVPIILKLRLSERVTYSIKCTSCKTKPLMGLRYRCIKCKKYTQCQTCFLTGRITHSHKLKHSLKEYSTSTNNKDIRQTCFGQLCSIFCVKETKETYSIVKPSKQFSEEIFKVHRSVDPSCEVEPLSAPEIQLQSVIRQLETQNRQLQQILIFGNRKDKDMQNYLEEYRLSMAGNIQKLKMLKNRINHSAEQDAKIGNCNERKLSLMKTHSTPAIYNNCKLNKFDNNKARNISPVTLLTELGESLPENLDKEFLDYHQAAQSLATNAANKANNIKERNDHLPHQSPVKLFHNNLDEALARLQQILANNFSIEDSPTTLDNTNLKFAVNEVEGMLTSIIDSVESSRSNSVLRFARTSN